MAEPARKLDSDIEPDIRPDLHVVKGGGDTTPERASLKALNDEESKPAEKSDGSVAEQESNGSNVIRGPWIDNASSGNSKGPSKTKSKFSFLKKRGPVVAIISALFGGGLAISLLGVASAPIAFVANVADDLNDQLASLDIRSLHMVRNKIPTAETQKALKGCGVLSIRCKFATMSKTQVERYKKVGIKVIGQKGGILGNRIKPEFFEFQGKGMGPQEFYDTLRSKAPSASYLKTSYRRAINMKYMGFADKSFGFVLEKFGITRKPPELRGNKLERIQELMNRSGALTIDDVRFTAYDEDGNPTTDPEKISYYQLDGDDRVPPMQYSKEDYAKMNKNVESVKAVSKPRSRIGGAVLKGLSVLGYLDLACSIKNMIGLAAVAAKVSNAAQLAKYAMPVLSLAGAMKAGDISEVDGEVLGDFFLGTDSRKTIPSADGSGTEPNPDFGKNAMDSDLYKISQTSSLADISSNSSVNTPYSLGMGANRLLSGVSTAAAVLNIISGLGSDSNIVCKIAQNWFVRGAGIIAAVAMGILSGGSSIALQAAIFAGMLVAFIAVNYMLNAALSGTMFESGMDEAPLERAAAVWSGTAVIESETAKSRGMMPGNSKQILAYNQLQNSSKLDYIAMESEGVNPLDASNQYSFLGSFVSSIRSYFDSSFSTNSIISGVPSLVSSSIASAVNPQTTFAKTIDPARFQTCDDDTYKKIGIDADVQCNVRYVMPTEDLALDTDEVARYMEENGYVETDTTTGLPEGYTPPAGSEAQSFAMGMLKGVVGGFYNTRTYGSTPAAKEYGQYLDYCVYRAMPFGETYEETSAFGSADSEFVNGKKCLELGEPYNYFRTYTFDLSVQSTIDDDELGSTNATDSTSTTSTTPTDTSSKTEKELAKMIIDSGNVTDSSPGGQIKQIADGSRTDVDIRILRLLAGLAIDNTFTISSLKRDEALSVGAGANSPHLSGRAVDISGEVNGVSVGYSGHNAKIQTFINSGSDLLASNCGIGAPNQEYVTGVKDSGCSVFVDIGTGPHIHFGVGT